MAVAASVSLIEWMVRAASMIAGSRTIAGEIDARD